MNFSPCEGGYCVLRGQRLKMEVHQLAEACNLQGVFKFIFFLIDRKGHNDFDFLLQLVKIHFPEKRELINLKFSFRLRNFLQTRRLDGQKGRQKTRQRTAFSPNLPENGS